jgi:hypothetical protein
MMNDKLNKVDVQRAVKDKLKGILNVNEQPLI